MSPKNKLKAKRQAIQWPANITRDYKQGINRTPRMKLLSHNQPLRVATLESADHQFNSSTQHSLADFTRLAAQLCQVPIAIVNLIGSGGAEFVSNVDLTATEAFREVAFCHHTLRQTDLFVVPDALADPRFANSPMVTAEPGIRFYAGLPLVTTEGKALGTLCLIDCVPRALTAEQEEALRALGRQVALQVELRRSVETLQTGSEGRPGEKRLLQDAFHDALTGLPNRALFTDRLELAIERAKRNEEHRFAVLFMDIDRFKNVNDSLGHTSGDQLLLGISHRLERHLRHVDTIARFGGDEFAILLDGIEDASDAIRVADRVQKELAVPFYLDGQEIFTSASIGIALSTTGYDRIEDILRDADTAMYRAKAQGKARHEVFDKVMHARAVALLQLETDLRYAVERQEFRVQYQPIISLATGRLSGFEALVRWQHPERGLIFPGDFIPTAEETGLIIPLGQIVLREACRQMSQWQNQFPSDQPLTLSVNLSGKQFNQPDLVEQVKDILQETGLDPCSLQLEITESVIMDNAETATAMLEQLRALNVQLSIDDFGTGYSSLSYLHRFPISILKIDRSFVGRMGVGDENTEIVQTILTLACKLGMDVVAEGIETQEQLSQLISLKCEYGQGFFFSKSVDGDIAEGLIRQQQPHWQVDTLPA